MTLFPIDIFTGFAYCGAAIFNYDQLSMISGQGGHKGLKVRELAATAKAGSLTGAGKSGLLQFSQRVDYAFFLLVELAKVAENGGFTGADVVSLRVIADEHKMSFYFLQKVALELRRAGLVRAGRGARGGYMLARGAEEITLKDIVEATEGRLMMMSCLHADGEAPVCVRKKWCQVRPGLQFINQTIVETLAQTTLYDFIHPTLWKRQQRALTRSK